MKRDLVICLTAMNYVYAKSSGLLRKHDVLCANEEVKLAISAIADETLCTAIVFDVMKLISFRRAIFEPTSRLKSLGLSDYRKVFLSFSSGWHFCYLYTSLRLNFDDLIFLDDGIGNLTETKNRFVVLKNLLSTVAFRRQGLFQPGRNFHNANAISGVTIYADLLPEGVSKKLSLIDVTETVKTYIGILSASFPISKLDRYGVYVQSDHAAYGGDRNKLLQYLVQNIKELQDKTGLPWVVKSKRTDPLRDAYLKEGLLVSETCLNIELLFSSNIEAVCTRCDTFALNSMRLDLPVDRYIRFDRARINTKGKENVVLDYAERNGFSLSHISGELK